MKTRHVLAVTVMSFMLLLPPSAAAQISSGMELGVGARAMAFAGNHTAAARDLSAVYWNPAALAFLPVREVQFSLDALNLHGETELAANGLTIPPGARMGGSRDRMRLNGLGIMAAMPTLQGGLTIAAMYDKPYAFDDYTVFEYELNDLNVKNDGRRYGDLNRWSGAFGIQVAPKLAVGLTFSLITGNERSPLVFETYNYLDSSEDVMDVEYQNEYLGYALTVGALYYPIDILKIGMKINAVTNIGFKGSWKYGYERRWTNSGEGRAYRAPSGALGAELSLPWLTAALDFRVTMPQTFALSAQDAEYMPDDMQAKDFKFGAGIGLEAPMPQIPVVLRAGYSFDQYDLYPIIHKYKNERIDWDDDGWGRGYKPAQDRHTIAAGAAFFSSGIGLELAYAYQMWAMDGHFDYYDYVSLKQSYSSHRVMAAIIYRY